MANRLPTLTSYVDQTWFLEPLKGPRAPKSYLDRFSPEVYNVGPDSHLSRFMYTLLGPSGIGLLRQNGLEARLALEEMGLELFDLDLFYSEPLRFARVANELYDEDPNGLIDRASWDKIRARDAHYRSRVFDYLDAARSGSTPFGMRMAARSGLGHEVSIIENYKALFDERSDDPLYLDYHGKTRATEEFTILPRRDIPRSEVQQITITGSPTGGFLKIFFRGEETTNIGFNAPASSIRAFLEALPSIAPGDVEVTGGPGPNIPWRIRFTGSWQAQNVPQITTGNSLTGGSTPLIQSTTEESGVDAADEVAFIAPRDRHHLQEALDRLRPQHTIPTVGKSPGLRSRQLWQSSLATSEYDEVVRFVTGAPNITWPKRDGINWIERGAEHAAPKSRLDRQYQYTSYHDIANLFAFTEEAVADSRYGAIETESLMRANRSEHVGPFNEFQTQVFPFLQSNDVVQFTVDMITADYTEPLTVRNVIESRDGSTTTQLINGVYPTSYAELPGAPSIRYDYEQFWASRERSVGTEYIEIDLGSVQAVNSINFEMTQKPVNITIEFDTIDANPRRRFSPITIDESRSSTESLGFTPEFQNPWSFVTYSFSNAVGELIFTRFIRISFERRNDASSPFVILDGGFHPWSIDIRNLRVGRNVTNQ